MSFKRTVCFILTLFFFAGIHAQSGKFSALSVKNEALKKTDAASSIEYLLANADSTASASDRRAVLYFAACLLEQSQRYDEAAASYAKAAGISAGNAEGMPAVSNEQIVLCAVRASLGAGNFQTAESYLNSAVRSSKDKSVTAYVNLYSAWTSLCRAASYEEASDTVELLKAYASMSSMKEVRNLVVFTLWYVTGKQMYADILLKEYPQSPEAMIVKGKVSLSPVPFWLYMVRNVSEVSETEAVTERKENSVQQQTSPASAASESVKRQIGLFREKQNAESLMDTLKKKGFNAYMEEEKRSSGTVYYLVIVDDDSEGTMGLKLIDAGYESYVLP